MDQRPQTDHLQKKWQSWNGLYPSPTWTTPTDALQARIYRHLQPNLLMGTTQSFRWVWVATA